MEGVGPNVAIGLLIIFLFLFFGFLVWKCRSKVDKFGKEMFGSYRWRQERHAVIG
jgi:hypothetical protein